MYSREDASSLSQHEKPHTNTREAAHNEEATAMLKMTGVDLSLEENDSKSQK